MDEFGDKCAAPNPTRSGRAATPGVIPEMSVLPRGSLLWRWSRPPPDAEQLCTENKAGPLCTQSSSGTRPSSRQPRRDARTRAHSDPPRHTPEHEKATVAPRRWVSMPYWDLSQMCNIPTPFWFETTTHGGWFTCDQCSKKAASRIWVFCSKKDPEVKCKKICSACRYSPGGIIQTQIYLSQA